MNIWDKQQQNWIKEILSKSGTELKEISDKNGNDLRFETGNQRISNLFFLRFLSTKNLRKKIEK